MRHWILKAIAWLLRLDYLVAPSNIEMLTNLMVPFVKQSERDGDIRGWNGDSKRRIATERFMWKHKNVPQRDAVLALEYAVRKVKA